MLHTEQIISCQLPVPRSAVRRASGSPPQAWGRAGTLPGAGPAGHRMIGKRQPGRAQGEKMAALSPGLSVWPCQEGAGAPAGAGWLPLSTDAAVAVGDRR